MSESSANDRILEIAGRLESISEELNDLAMDLVRSALVEGHGQRPEEEKRVSKARRSVDRATAQLRGLATSD